MLKRFLVLVGLCLWLLPAFSQSEGRPGRDGYTSHSVLSSGNWYQVAMDTTGVFRLGYSDLADLGLDVDRLDPRNLRVYHNGGGLLNELNAQSRFDDLEELSVFVMGEEDGKFDRNDYLLFYARGPVTWQYKAMDGVFEHRPNAYETRSYAFITADLGRGQRIALAVPPSGDDLLVTEFLDRQVYDKDNYNLISGGRTYYADIIEGNNALVYPFTFPGIKNNRWCNVKVELAGRNFSPASFQLLINNNLQQTINIQQTAPGSDKAFAYAVSGKAHATCSNPRVEVTLRHVGVPGTTSLGYVDYISVNAWRSLSMVGTSMGFRNPEANDPARAYRYRIGNVPSGTFVWNVTDSIHPVVVNGQWDAGTYEFLVLGDLHNEFIAFNAASAPAPVLMGKVANQDLHGDRDYDYLMVVYPDFLAQAERLKALHAHYDPDLRIKIATPQQIYNEFSCGAQDVTAIRDYCRMLYHDARPLRYLLLFGDASFDYRNRKGTATFVPTYEAWTATNINTSVVTDDYFCFMDEHEGDLFLSVPDIAAGRLPVSTVEQAEQMVDKIERYLATDESTMQPWRNVITFVCDDGESNEFFVHSEQYAQQIKQTGGYHLVVDKIYLDAYPQESTPSGQLAPEVNAAINKRMDKGALIVNYVGHGGEVQLSEERILQRADVNSWRNGPRCPLMITGTCEFSRYDDHTRTSLGEYAFLNEYGGMIAMFTTSRVTYGNYNKRFISGVYNHLFVMEQGQRRRLGDVFRMAKNHPDIHDRKYVLFGDPALRLPMPTWTVETTAIDDTIRALQPTTLEGVVRDQEGQIATDFNGLVYVSVYDKETVYHTNGDHGVSSQPFSVRNSVIFNGKTEAVNGHFSLSFTVPRDISYSFGQGMVSYYATDYTHEAAGKFEDFVIGGFYEDAVLDEQAPLVQLYIDDERFVDGGITGDSPMLIAYVQDESGINTTGTGIGHDIVATLSGPTNTSFVLNDYFVADAGTQGKGVIRYRMQDLEAGDYTLTLKVWDIYNNSGTASVSFRVVNSDMMEIENPLCIPNPVVDEAGFSFGHNQIGNNMDVRIRIYDFMGRMVTELHEQVYGVSTRANPIPWNGCASNGKRLPAGIYVYVITVTNTQQETATVSSKLIINH
jgi:hypothetical protein